MTDAPAIPADAADLEGGGRMPLLGFGTWNIKGEDAVSSTATALECGYRHLDTAKVYRNEAEVGRGLAASGVDRAEVFVATKCPPDDAGRELDTLRQSLELLATEYVDLWLVHWPTDQLDRAAMWRAFVEARETGLARDIGVSNFDVAMIDELVTETGVKPAVNQIEWSPLLFDRDVLEEHRSRGVVLEGYSALRNGAMDAQEIRGIAEELGRTPAQVIMRWHLQHGVVVIPKSRTPERIRSNADVAGFELSAEQMATIDGLGVRG